LVHLLEKGRFFKIIFFSRKLFQSLAKLNFTKLNVILSLYHSSASDKSNFEMWKETLKSFCSSGINVFITFAWIERNFLIFFNDLNILWMPFSSNKWTKL